MFRTAIALALSLSFAACGTDQGPTPPEAPAPTDQPSIQPTGTVHAPPNLDVCSGCRIVEQRSATTRTLLLVDDQGGELCRVTYKGDTDVVLDTCGLR